LKIGLVILNKNEAEALPFVLSQIPIGYFDQIIAIDGGSTDGSIDIIEKYGFEILIQESFGRGSGFALGFQFAIENGIDFLCFLSTDGNENPVDLIRMVDIARNTEPDLIIASRMQKGSWNEEDSKLFRPRKWGNQFFAILAFTLFGRGNTFISDPINGFRGLSVSAWKKLRPDAAHFNIEYQISVRAYRERLNIIEFPTHEGKRIGGKSGARALPTTLAMFKVLKNELLGRSAK